MAAGNRKRFVYAIGAIILGSLFAWANYHFEPFARRVEGRTVTQWARQFAATGNVDERVVELFGPAAAPRLVATIQSGRWAHDYHDTIRELIGLIRHRSPEKEKMMLAAGAWLSWLHAKGYAAQLPRDEDFHQWMDAYDDYFYAPRHVQLAITTPQEAAVALKEWQRTKTALK